MKLHWTYERAVCVCVGGGFSVLHRAGSLIAFHVTMTITMVIIAASASLFYHIMHILFTHTEHVRQRCRTNLDLYTNQTTYQINEFDSICEASVSQLTIMLVMLIPRHITHYHKPHLKKLFEMIMLRRCLELKVLCYETRVRS